MGLWRQCQLFVICTMILITNKYKFTLGVRVKSFGLSLSRQHHLSQLKSVAKDPTCRTCPNEVLVMNMATLTTTNA